jgi:hypothetical protein
VSTESGLSAVFVWPWRSTQASLAARA